MKNRYNNDLEFKKRILNSVKIYQKKYPYRTWANRVIQNHKRRGYVLNFSRQELEILAKKVDTCHLCGITLNYKPKGKKGWKRNSPSLDNIENKEKIDIFNIQIICSHCNNAKNMMNNIEFIDYCKTIIERSKCQRKEK